jgi:hypothetical protein
VIQDLNEAESATLEPDQLAAARDAAPNMTRDDIGTIAREALARRTLAGPA